MCRGDSQMARVGRRHGEMSGVRPDTYRCSEAAEEKLLRASYVFWTQFYAHRFSPSNRYPLSRQCHTVQLSDSSTGNHARIDNLNPLGQTSYIPTLYVEVLVARCIIAKSPRMAKPSRRQTACPSVFSRYTRMLHFKIPSACRRARHTSTSRRPIP